MASSKVFISYRHDDAAGFSHAIYDRLVEHLPKNHVFMDVAGIAPGADFVQRLETTVDQCQVLLALIGKRWVPTLTRRRALILAAILHVAGFAVLAAGASDIDGVMIFVFGIVPAAFLYMASFAMRRLVRS